MAVPSPSVPCLWTKPGTAQQQSSIPSNGAFDPHTARYLSKAISDLQLSPASPAPNSAAKLAALTSPCFFHRRFDDAVNIEKVLEEIHDDDQLSHSRLMQTAAGVREVGRQLQRRPIKRAVRNVMIVTKARDNTLITLTRELTEWLLSTPRYGRPTGVNVYVDAKLKQSKRFDMPSLLAQNQNYHSMLRFWTPELCWSSPDKFDLVITLGGDGTVLYTSWLFQRVVPPILSFSLGSLGFLTNFQFEQYKTHLDRIMGDSGMHINLRMRFTCTIYRSAASTLSSSTSTTSLMTEPANENVAVGMVEGEQHEVLNELVIDRGPSSYISSLDLYANESLLTRINADGLILSTPTGSTAYSLSAGGSLVHPDIPAILLTPICPHTLSFRPMLLNDSVMLKVKIPEKGRGSAFVSFDGKGRVELGRGDAVVVQASQYPFPTVLSQPLEWFDSISRTLRWNTRTAEQKDWSGDNEGDGTEEEGERPEFDIDFDDGGEDTAKDSGYSGASSSVEGWIPGKRKFA
ncbi:NAD(+) kinase [Elasticomyces elasticus]|nr:NAD(+) kinase [Elasticomyces elasticus]